MASTTIFSMIIRYSFGVIALVACVCVAMPGQDAKSQGLPSGVLRALSGDESAYCEQFLADRRKGCHHDFQANLVWLELKIAPTEQPAILVENRNTGACSSEGCFLYLFVQQPNLRFVQILEAGHERGNLTGISVSKNVTSGHYDLQKAWLDGKTWTIYEYNGVRYTPSVTWSL